MSKLSNKFSCEIEILVPFFDVDSMNIVWHGHYVKYFEMARCALLEKLAYNYIQMLGSGYGWPVIDLQIRYAQPLTFNQKIIVEATLEEWEHRLRFSYRIYDKSTKKRLSKGQTTQVAVDIKNKEMQFVSPDILFDKLKACGVIE